MHISRQVADKALRLSTEGKVRPTGKWRVFQVEGDHDTYKVFVSDPVHAFGFCPCPSDKIPCSHLVAAAAYEQTYPSGPAPLVVDPFAGL